MQIFINMDTSIMWMTEKWGYQKSIFFFKGKIKRSNINPTWLSVNGSKQWDYMWHLGEIIGKRLSRDCLE